MIPPSPPPPVKRRIRLSDVFVLSGIAVLLAFALANIQANMAAAGVHPGFGFLTKEAGFDVSETLIPYSPGSSYIRVILAGLANTVFLAGVCIILATVIGVLMGLVSVGPSPAGRWLAVAYVELFRNLPKLLVLLVLFVAAVNGLPHVREAMSAGPFHLSNRSLNFPVPLWDGKGWILLLALAAGLILPRLIEAHLQKHWGRSTPMPLSVLIGCPIVCVLAASVLFQVPSGFSVPELKGFDFQGGARVSLQFCVIAVTLGIYHGAQIAEVVRGGLQSVPKGQSEAAQALGLTRSQTIRLIILPQVIRIIIPPMNNQYVNLIKNTSIAIAVGYSDLMSVSGTVINQSFKPLEMMLITMGLYLVLCMSVATALNTYQARLIGRETR
ncbi:ABC transporter permease subunit [Roseibium denhamense]|uniref:Amino acid ABC transporter membrane protein 1, PAAT family n=1 Tax=Roseibium denhamense TaxID=76305 RepID=A0ABY1P3Q8_9HYPH|nr:ABC transporter permease subunit [Roseibium denhamense]SMP24084.1 amino acid ABC transporter membrane protein 1, PAAT family [Roseibium denhamense]